jgi:hypothetical protein
MKKNIFIIFLGLFSILCIKAQEPLKADAGGDQHFCFETDWITAELGGNPTAIGGISPYTYRWWSNPDGMIDSETSPNPSVSFLGDIIVYVEVTDFFGNIETDSAFITMSKQQINYADNPQNLLIDYYINYGDSVFLTGNVSVLNPNSTFMWSPCESIISDCNVPDGFWVKPTNTTTYTLTATDEFNCSETFFNYFYKVYVGEVGIKNNNVSNNIFIYPNPTTGVLNLIQETIDNGQLTINNVEIFDMQGRVLLKSEKTTKSINIYHLKAGIYFIKFEDGRVEKFVKE